jgi:hypothetical protein
MTEQALVSPADFLKQQLSTLDKTMQPSGGIRIKVGPTGIEAPDGKEGKSITVVVVAHEIVHAYYSKPYNPSSISPPDCFAHGEIFDQLAPIETAPEPQAQACSVCPMNEFGSAPNGKGKACRNSRLLAVLPADPGLIADHPIWTLSVPPTSIKEYENYLRDLRDDHGLTNAFVATKITQAKKCDWAAPRFEFVEKLPDEMVATAIARMEEARKIIGREPNYESDGE